MTSDKKRIPRIALFNHKGGVGKTTLTLNIADALGRAGKKILLIDSDPQCNLTSHLFESSMVDDLLDNSDTPEGRTLWTALKPIVEAQGAVKNVTPYETALGNVSLIPGDIRLAEFEEALVDLWTACFQRKVKGFFGVNALSQVAGTCAADVNADYIFYDTGPNIGPLNRIILLDCDFFIVPASCDYFSIRAFKTLGRTLASWIYDWRAISHFAPDGYSLLLGAPRFLGFIPQRFRTYKKGPVAISKGIISEIQSGVRDDIVEILNSVYGTSFSSLQGDLKLGEVKDYASLVQKSQIAGIAISEIDKNSSGHEVSAKRSFSNIAKNIINRIAELS